MEVERLSSFDIADWSLLTAIAGIMLLAMLVSRILILPTVSIASMHSFAMHVTNIY